MNFCTSIFKKRIHRDSKFAWLALVASICILCSNLGFLWSFSLFYNSLLDEYKTSKEKTAWIGSIPISLTFFLAPFPNWMSSKLGTRLSIVIGLLCTGAALLLTSFAKNINVMFLTFSFLYGIGSSTLNMCTIRAISLYFDKRLSIALGLLTGGTALLQITLTQLIAYLLSNYGLHKTFQIYAVVSTVICLLCSLVYFPPASQPEQSEDVGSAGKNLNDYISLFKNKVFCLWITTMIVIALEHGVSMIHQVQVAVENGVSEKTAKQFPFYAAISSTIGRIAVGPFLDKKIIDSAYAFQGLLLFGAIVAFIGSFATTATHLIGFILIFSFIDGAFQSGVYPMTRILIGLNKLSEAISVSLMLSSITLMLGPPFVGFVVDNTENYKAFFYVAGAPLIVGFLLLFGLRCKGIKYSKLSLFETDKENLDINDILIRKAKETSL